MAQESRESTAAGARTISTAERSPTPPVPPLPRGAADLLDRAWSELAAAEASAEAGERYVQAHLAALRAAAAMIAARGRPRLRGRRALNVWEGLAAVAPELQSWASAFSASAERRAAVESGRAGALTDHEADQHVALASDFTRLVAHTLGLPGPAFELSLVAS